MQNVIRNFIIPPKPTLNVDMTEWMAMQILMTELRKQVVKIKEQQDLLAELKLKLAATKGIFKGKERKSLEQQIQQSEHSVNTLLDELQTIVKANGYPNAQSFTNLYNQSEEILTEYNREFEKWQDKNTELTKTLKKKPKAPPEIKNVHKQLRQLRQQETHRAIKKEFIDL